MKDKQTACLVLMLIVVCLVYGTQKSYKKMTVVRKEAAAEKQSAMQAQQAYSTAKVSLDTLEAETSNLRQFYAEWEPYLRATRSPQSSEQRIIDLVKRAEVFAVSQRFELISNMNDPVFEYILRAHVTIEDEYSKAFNWFSALEEELPTSRVTSCKLYRGDSGDDLGMELIVDLPIVKS